MKKFFQYIFAKRLLDTKNGKMHSVFSLDVRRFFFLKRMLGLRAAFPIIKEDIRTTARPSMTNRLAHVTGFFYFCYLHFILFMLYLYM